jgi:osmotically-inducible protein OsmY
VFEKDGVFLIEGNQLEEAVRESLDGDPLFDDTQINVGVFGDAVRHSGLVHSQAAREAARRTLARPRVDEVINEIEIRPSPQRSSP